MPNPTVPAAATGLPCTQLPLADLIERERLRTRIEAAVARLIDALDAIDGDADLEDDDAEPVNEDGDVLDQGEEWLLEPHALDQTEYRGSAR